jgi:alpha/beta superfamily hydrolase
VQASPVTFESDGLNLEGLLHLPDAEAPFSGMVVCHPHPQYGGDMHNGVVTALVQAGVACGLAVLRFNFRGTGSSQGSYEGGAGEVRDVQGATEYLGSLPEISGATVLAGYSFGALMALSYSREATGLNAIVLVSPPTVAGPVTLPGAGPRALVVSGDRDEYCDSGALRESLAPAGDRATLQIVPGADHFWWGADGELRDTVKRFLE